MYTILVCEDNTLHTTNKERIMQRSKLFDTLWFLVYPDYKGYDLTNSTVVMEYILPVSKKYCTEFLVLAEDRYKDYLKYTLPFDTNLTAEAGEIKIQLSFIYSDLDESGNNIQRVRKISSTTIDIVPIEAWSDIVPDSALTALDQRIIKIDSQMKALNELTESIYDTKADNIMYDESTNELQLMSGSNPIGDKVVLDNCDFDEDGIPVVDFSNGEWDDTEGDTDDSGNSEEDDLYNDVVLF